MIKIIGDIMLDAWVNGDCQKVSPEAPVLVVKESSKEYNVGGAGNLSLNLSNLGTHTSLYGSVGSDTPGLKIREILIQNSVKSYLSLDSKCTTTKTRIIGQNGQHLIRVDKEEQYKENIPAEKLLEDLTESDTVIVSDYNKGVIKKDTVQKILQKCKNVYVDPKQDFTAYVGVFLVKPNMKEYESWFGAFEPKSAQQRCKENHWTWLIVTDGANGIHVVSKDFHKHIQGEEVEIADVSGAGDSVLAVIAHYLQTHDMVSCCELAVKGAQKIIQKRGVSIIDKTDIEDTVVWTNGVFDILHNGHLELLKFAKQQGDILIVGINSDSSVKRLKGEGRPFNNSYVREQQLLQLPWVDKVVVFEDDTPLEKIQEYSPDIIVKGGDYTVETTVGNELAEVKIFPTVEGFSTTQIMEKVKNNAEKNSK